MDYDTNLDNLLDDALNPTAESADDNGQQENQSGEQSAPQQEQQEQDHAERARQAAARREREAEVQRREARAYQQARAEVSATLQRLGIRNPKTDKAISSVEELEAYEKGLSDERLSSGNGTAEDIKRVVREAIHEAQPVQRTNPADDPEIQRQLAEIRAMDPAMTDIGAILASDAGDKFRGYVNKGLTFVEAYTLAAKDRLASIQVNRANAKAGGKSHLNATRQQGIGALSVPADEMALFRELNPDATEADIQKYYNADKKKFGK